MSKALQQLVEHIDLRAINNKQEPPLEGDQQDDVLGDELDTEFWIKVSFVKCTCVECVTCFVEFMNHKGCRVKKTEKHVLGVFE